MTQRRLQRQVNSHCPDSGNRRPASFDMSCCRNSLSCTVLTEKGSMLISSQLRGWFFLNQLLAQELFSEPVHVPPGLPLADLKGATNMSDDVIHGACPVDGDPDLGRHRIEPDHFTLLEVEQDPLSVNKAPRDVGVL